MLYGGYLASYSSQHVGGHSWSVSHCKGSCNECFSRPDAEGSAIAAFSPLAVHRHVLHRQGFSSSVSEVVAVLT